MTSMVVVAYLASHEMVTLQLRIISEMMKRPLTPGNLLYIIKYFNGLYLNVIIKFATTRTNSSLNLVSQTLIWLWFGCGP